MPIQPSKAVFPRRSAGRTQPLERTAAGEPSSLPAELLCVVGLEGDGRALTSRLFGLLGLELDEDRPVATTPPSPSEPEPLAPYGRRSIIELNDELLERLGGSWHEPPLLEEGWEHREDLADLRERAMVVVREELAGEGARGWQDPGTSLAIPLWRAVDPEMRFVICIRNPLDVSRSLQRDHGFVWAKSLDLWQKHVMASLRDTEGARRLFVFFEDYFEDLPGTLRRLAGFLGHPERAADPELLRRARALTEDESRLAGSHPADLLESAEASFSLKAFYLALQAVRDGNPDEGERSKKWIEALSVFCDCIDDERQVRLRIEALVESQRAALAEQTALREEALDATQRLALAERAARRAEALVATQRVALTGQAARLAELEQRLAESDARAAALASSRRDLERHIAAIQSWTVLPIWERIRSGIHRVLPPGSLRARPYEALVRLLRRGANVS